MDTNTVATTTQPDRTQAIEDTRADVTADEQAREDLADEQFLDDLADVEFLLDGIEDKIAPLA